MRCKCRKRIRTETDGSCVNTDVICKLCLGAKQEEVDAIEKEFDRIFAKIDDEGKDFAIDIDIKVVDDEETRKAKLRSMRVKTKRIESEILMDEEVDVSEPVDKTVTKPVKIHKRVLPRVGPYGQTTSDINERGPKKS